MKMLSDHYKETFGCKVYKLSLDGGFTCPNRDGTLGTEGCIFCTGSGEFAEGGQAPIGQSKGSAARTRTENTSPIFRLSPTPTVRWKNFGNFISRLLLRKRS